MATGYRATGWCPAGRRAEDGEIPAIYPLEETESDEYGERTRRNVLDSDGTLVLAWGAPTGGAMLTVETARANGKPVFLGNPLALDPAFVHRWIEERGIEDLNVAGPRESEAPGIYGAAHGFLIRLLKSMSGEG